MAEAKDFREDECKTATERNRRLSTLVLSTWPDFEIVKIERIEQDGKAGWQITYRE